MAKVVIHCKRIGPAVTSLVAELEADIAAYRESCIKDFMGSYYDAHTGWFWWKTSRSRTREEAERKYDTGYFRTSDEDEWFMPRAKRGEDRFKSNIQKAQRLARAAQEADGVFITLDEDEVAFLKLARR